MVSKQNTREYPIHVIREDLRQCSARQAALLSRSVGRLTSYDARPCTEYRQEVTAQYAVVDRLLYLQQCRSTLEQCIASGAARLRYRWRDGHRGPLPLGSGPRQSSAVGESPNTCSAHLDFRRTIPYNRFTHH